MTELEVLDIFYKNFEFFLSKEDIRILFPLENNLTYTEYLNNVAFLYEAQKNEFQYNIRFVPIYIEIKEKLKQINNLRIKMSKINQDSSQYASQSDSQTAAQSAAQTAAQNQEMTKLIGQFQTLIEEVRTHNDLYFYQEEYVYAHHKMNEFRNNSDAFEDIIQSGGGITLEQFKQKIRDKIMRL